MSDFKVLYCSCEEPSKEELQRDWATLSYNPGLGPRGIEYINLVHNNMDKILRKIEENEFFNREKYFYAIGHWVYFCFKLKEKECKYKLVDTILHDFKSFINEVIKKSLEEMHDEEFKQIKEERKTIEKFLNKLLNELGY